MKKSSIVLLAVLAMSSCNKKLNEAMKSADKNLILQTANEYYAAKKWKNALALYDRLPKDVSGNFIQPVHGFVVVSGYIFGVNACREQFCCWLFEQIQIIDSEFL